MTIKLVDTSFTRKYPYGWIQRIVSTSLESIMILIFVTYLYHIYKFSKADGITSNPDAFKRKLYHTFTIITLLTYSVQGLNYCLNSWSLYQAGIYCNVYQKFSVWLYHFGKFCLYIVLVLRIKVVFNGTTFDGFVNRMVRIVYILLAVFVIGTTIGDFATITSTSIHTTKTIHYCLVNPLPTWGLTGFIALDLTISILCLTLFTYPLKQLIKRCEHRDAEKITLTQKYTILTTTAVISTATLIFFVDVFQFGWLSLLDNVINSICLLFMSSWYSKYYQILCCCCISLGFRTNAAIHNMETNSCQAPNNGPEIMSQLETIDIIASNKLKHTASPRSIHSVSSKEQKEERQLNIEINRIQHIQYCHD